MRTTPRDYRSDPALATLANTLPTINFGIDPDERTSFFQLESWRNVSLFRDGKMYRVRLYIGGKLRIIGITTDGPSAGRFADAARLFFWRYRLRDCRPPCETDMNFSLGDAQHDIDNTPGVSELLFSIRDHLAKFGELKIATDDGNTKRKQREQRRTARGELQSFLADVTADSVKREQEYAKLRAEVTGSFDQIKIAFHHILEQLALASKEREQLRHMVAAPIGGIFVGSPNPQTAATPCPPPDWVCRGDHFTGGIDVSVPSVCATVTPPVVT